MPEEYLSTILNLLKLQCSDDISIQKIKNEFEHGIKVKGLTENVKCHFTPGKVFLKIKIEGLNLMMDDEDFSFPKFVREIIFKENNIDGNGFGIKNLKLNDQYFNESSYRYQNKVHFKFIGNIINPPLTFVRGDVSMMDVEMRDNKINSIFFCDHLKHGSDENEHSRFSFHLTGVNEIEMLGEVPKNQFFVLFFNGDQKIGRKKPSIGDISKQKYVFLGLKERVAKMGDKFQESILTKEIMECERKLLKNDKFLNSWESLAILYFEKIFSNYGFSWFFPFLWLLIFNAFFALIVKFLPSCGEFSFVNVFIDFFKPLSDISEIHEICKDNSYLKIITIFQKLILAIFIYEIVKAARRFSRK